MVTVVTVVVVVVIFVVVNTVVFVVWAGGSKLIESMALVCAAVASIEMYWRCVVKKNTDMAV